MKLGPKAITTAALAVAVLLAGSIAEAMAYQVNCRALYNQCEQDKCGDVRRHGEGQCWLRRRPPAGACCRGLSCCLQGEGSAVQHFPEDEAEILPG